MVMSPSVVFKTTAFAGGPVGSLGASEVEEASFLEKSFLKKDMLMWALDEMESDIVFISCLTVKYEAIRDVAVISTM